METSTEGNKLGRPKEEFSDFEKEFPQWHNHIITMYEKGASDVEIKAYIADRRGSLSNDLWYRWMDQEPIFSETIKKGRLLSAAWWEKEGRTNLKIKEFNYTGWFMNMRNRFKWGNGDKEDGQPWDAPKKVDVNINIKKFR